MNRFPVVIAVAVLVLASGCAPEQRGSGNPPVGAVDKDEAVAEEVVRARPKASRAVLPEPPVSLQAQRPVPAPAQMLERAGGKLSAGFADAVNIRQAAEPVDRENYGHFEDNPLHLAAEDPFSTFSIDVDTGSYSNVRRLLQAGRLPPQDAVRSEEFINYFGYDYPAPAGRERPFRVTTEMGPTPWNPDTRLLHIGLKGFEIPREQLPHGNLVFLVDVSGSMRAPDKLDLLKNAVRLLVQQLDGDDRIAIAVYAGAAGTVLESTPGDQQAKIMAAIDGLAAGGSTNGGAGIRLAYSLARQGLIAGGINRVIVATDGDFNVGTVDFESLVDLVERERESGIGLTTLGFGAGNYNDHLMERLADAGNGNHAYIDTLAEARKVLVEEMSATLFTIARDVKIQLEFNPAVVAEYRLIGYENRVLRREDFANDKVDAGEIGAGHTVTALYELTLVDSPARLLGEGRYQQHPRATGNPGDEVGLLRLRYKPADSPKSLLLEQVLPKAAIAERLAETSERFRFAAAVAAFGQRLRDGRYLGDYDYDRILELARGARGGDPFGYRGEFLTLVSLAKALDRPASVARR